MSKSKFLIVALMLSIALVSCKPGGSGYNFVDQPLQGKIGGVSWQFVSGTAEYHSSGDTIWLDLYDIDPTPLGNPWAIGAYNAAQDTILFVVPATIGLQELSLSGQTVTLYDKSSAINYICVEGAVEILTIDSVTHVVTGRIDAKSDSNNYVNGNFTAAYQ